MQTANAVIPIDSILYAERCGSRIHVFIKGLAAPNNVVYVEFPTSTDAKVGLNELYAEMVSE